MPLMPWAASPSAMARTSSGCILVKSATWSKVRAVLSTSHTAVAFGISGALLMANLLCAPPLALRAKPAVIDDDGNWPYISRPGGVAQWPHENGLDSARKQSQVLSEAAYRPSPLAGPGSPVAETSPHRSAHRS